MVHCSSFVISPNGSHTCVVFLLSPTVKMGSPPTVTFDGGGGAAWHSQTEISPSSQVCASCLCLRLMFSILGMSSSPSFRPSILPLRISIWVLTRSVLLTRPSFEPWPSDPCGTPADTQSTAAQTASMLFCVWQPCRKGGKNGLLAIEQSKCK